jgi:molybdopterin-guanine dinucleotide biosynthesis protein A
VDSFLEKISKGTGVRALTSNLKPQTSNLKPQTSNLKPPMLNALILAGGRSTRMGTDKGLLTYHGLPQRQYLAEVLRPLCAEVWVSLRADQAPLPGERVLPDETPDAGPLSGIRTAFAHRADCTWLTVPCDWPLLTARTLRYLVEARQPGYLATAFRDPHTGTLEPLLACWEPAAAAPLADAWARGERSPRRWLGAVPVRVLDRPFPEEWGAANTPAEAQVLLERLRDERSEKRV